MCRDHLRGFDVLGEPKPPVAQPSDSAFQYRTPRVSSGSVLIANRRCLGAIAPKGRPQACQTRGLVRGLNRLRMTNAVDGHAWANWTEVRREAGTSARSSGWKPKR